MPLAKQETLKQRHGWGKFLKVKEAAQDAVVAIESRY